MSPPTRSPSRDRQQLDEPGAVRPGEELDVERLASYLASALSGDLPRERSQLEVEQFPRGFSNLTYRLRWGDRDWVLRRGPFGSTVRSAHDMAREHRILERLSPVYPKAPRPVLMCEDGEVLGAPFYLMERVHGEILRGAMPSVGRPSAQRMARVAGELVATLVELHAVDHQAAGLGDLGRPQGYARRQIDGWSQRYRQARTDEVPEMDQLASWLDEQEAAAVAAEEPAALIHNDFKYDNLVLDPQSGTRVIAVLDWEMATVGDPRMDLGTSLGYWIEAGDPPEMQALAFGPTALPGNPTRAEMVELYAAASGREVENPVFWYAYGLFKIATIVQQIYARFRAGHTNDPRFAGLDAAVRCCAEVAWQAVQLGRIDRLHTV